MNITSCLCSVCNKLPEVVLESPCCHSLFCWDCVVDIGSSSNNNNNTKESENGGECLCAVCQERVNVEGFRENFAIQKIIDNITISCVHEGCDARFPASQRASHEASCAYVPILCPHSELCGIITRGVLEKHEETCAYRPVCCHFCAALVKGGELADHLANDCADAWVECVNRCGTEGIKRASMDEHLTNSCPFTIVRCPYEPYGCNEEFARECTDVHLQSRAGVHLNMLATNIEPFREFTTMLRSEVSSMRAEITQLRDEVATLRTQTERNHVREYVASLGGYLCEAAHNITFAKVLPFIALIVIVYLLLKVLTPFKQILLFGFITWIAFESINSRREGQRQQHNR